jgi:hypothetical protein
MFNIEIRGILAEFERLIAEKDEQVSALTTEKVLKLKKELADKTPVDTGLASSSWESTKTAKGEFSISNKVPYIDYLNAGSSKQAPAFFVENTALKYGVPNGQIVKYGE